MILVTTPTGNSGKLIVKQLVEMGQPVRVLTRHPENIAAEVRAGIEIVQGSLLDVESLTRAMEGCETVYYCIPQSTDPTNIMQYYEDFAQTAVQAIKSAGTRRLVYLSGVGKDSGIMTAGTASALFLGEDILVGSGAAVRALRCPVFFDNLFWQIPPIMYTNGWGLPVPGDYKLPQVAVKDIANAAVRWLTDASWQDVQGVGVLGPEDLSHDQIAEALSETMGKTIRFRQTSRAEHIAILTNEGLSTVLAEGVADMFAAIADGLFTAEPRTAETTTPTTIQQWLREDFMPVLRGSSVNSY